MASSTIASAGFESSNDHHDSLMSVLELTKKPLLAVPPEFVCPNREPAFDDLLDNHEKPLSSSFPTIDLKNFTTEATADLELEKLHLACKNWGILQVLLLFFFFFLFIITLKLLL